MNAFSKMWFVIINPTSGNGSCKQKWPKIKWFLECYGFDFEFAFTEYPNHGVSLVHRAVKNQFKNIISIGGDGTLHSIVNGIFSQDIIPTATIHVGVIPIGTGNDWVKTHNIPRDIEQAIKIIKKGYVKQQDVGKITFLNTNRLPVFFNNCAGVGFDGYVVSRVNQYKRLGTFAYLYGALTSIWTYKNFSSKIGINSEELTGQTFMISIGVCLFSGGGMQLTSKANPFDGLLDVSIIKPIHFFDIIQHIKRLFNGHIDKIQKAKCLKTNSIKIEFNDKNSSLIQADGELIGSGNIEIGILNNCFSFYSLKD